jgi:hypothetical protein
MMELAAFCRWSNGRIVPTPGAFDYKTALTCGEPNVIFVELAVLSEAAL